MLPRNWSVIKLHHDRIRTRTYRMPSSCPWLSGLHPSPPPSTLHVSLTERGFQAVQNEKGPFDNVNDKTPTRSSGNRNHSSSTSCPITL